MNEGSWSFKNNRVDCNIKLDRVKSIVKMLYGLNEQTRFVYKNSFEKAIKNLLIGLCEETGQYKMVLNEFALDINRLSIFNKVKLYISLTPLADFYYAINHIRNKIW